MLALVASLHSAGHNAPGEQALIIANLIDPTNALTIAIDYEIALLDTTDDAPFVLYSVDEVRKDAVMLLMSTDLRIVWVEDDFPLGSPEGADQRPEDIRARVGGSIPAVFSGPLGAAYNSDYLDLINWKESPTLSNIGRTVRVAVLDTGLSPYQPELWKSVFATMDATSTDSPYDLPAGLDTNGNGLVDEAVGHGTFVTSIVITVAPAVQIAVAKVADSDGVASSWTIIKGLAFAVVSGCELANVSLGSRDRPKALSNVLDWTDDNGLTVVAGAGNEDADKLAFPARYSKVIGVTGIDPKELKATFSNYEGNALQAAPAVLVAGAWWKGGAVGWSGTSFSTPFVTGCLADTAQWRDVWSPNRVRRLARDVGADIDDLNPDYEGRLGLRLDWTMLIAAQRSAIPD